MQNTLFENKLENNTTIPESQRNATSKQTNAPINIYKQNIILQLQNPKYAPTRTLSHGLTIFDNKQLVINIILILDQKKQYHRKISMILFFNYLYFNIALNDNYQAVVTDTFPEPNTVKKHPIVSMHLSVDNKLLYLSLAIHCSDNQEINALTPF